MGRKRRRAPAAREREPVQAPSAPDDAADRANKIAPGEPFSPYVYPPAAEPSWRRDATIAGVLLLLAVLMRFVGLGSKDLWFDEVQSVFDGRFPRFRGMSHWMYFHAMQFFAQFSGDLTTSVRIYSALLGSLTIPMAFLIGRRLFGLSAGIIAAAILLLQPFHLYYSQEARYYAPMVFYSLLPIWLLAEFTTRQGRWRFLLLPLVFLACWVNVGHHPTSAPFAIAVAGWTVAALALSRWGADSLREAIPVLRRIPYLRVILGALGALAVLLSFFVAGGLWERIYTSMFTTPWGETREVSFTWRFFRRHIWEFGWNFMHWRSLQPVAPMTNLVLILAGTGIALWRRPAMGLLLAGSIAAVFVAIFAYSLPNTHYLYKYACCVVAPVVILIGAALGQLVDLAVRYLPGFRWKREIILGLLVVLIAAGQAKAVTRYYAQEKMPLRPQLRWVNENVDQPAAVFVFGHAAYLAAIYKDVLENPHELIYLPRERMSEGILEQELLKGAAMTGRRTYFARCWTWDLPQPFRDFLDTQGKVAARFPSYDGPNQAGFLIEIPPNDEWTNGSADREGGAINGSPIFPRPELIAEEEGTAPTMLLRQCARAVYTIPVQGGVTYRIEIDVTPRLPRFWAFEFAAETDDRLVFYVDESLTESATLRGYLTPGEDSETFTLTHLTDLQHLGPQENGLGIDRIRVEEVESPREDVVGAVPGVSMTTIPWHMDGQAMRGWQMLPETLATGRWDEEAGAIVLHFPGPTEGNIVSPPVAIEGGAMVQVRVRVRPHELYGSGGNAMLIFMDASGRPLEQHFLASPSWKCTIRWHPVEYPLWLHREWHYFDGIRPAPPNAAFATVALPFWKTDERRYDTAANTLTVPPVEVGVFSIPD